MIPDSSTSLPAADPLLSLLQGAQMHRSSRIRVTGPSGLSVLLWLYRHGFEQVAYVKAGGVRSPEQADAVIVADICDPGALQTLLSTGPRVREGGVLIVRSPLPPAGDSAHADPIHRLLELNGYAVEQCRRGRHRELHIARRRSQQWLKAA
jgi:hypothetical protein